MGEAAKQKIIEMPLRKRLKFSYQQIVKMILISGGISIVALLVLFGSIYSSASAIGGSAMTIVTVCTVIGLINIIVAGVVAVVISKRTGEVVIESELAPLHEVEEVAGELTRGNLHSNQNTWYIR